MGELKVDTSAGWVPAQDSNWGITTSGLASNTGVYHYDGEIQYMTDTRGFLTRSDGSAALYEYLMHATGGRPYIGRYKSADQNIATGGTGTAVTFPSTLDGTGLQGFTTSNDSLFTVPIPGLYQINAQISWPSSAASGRGQIMVDNSLGVHLISGAISLPNAPANNACAVSGVFKMSTGDTLQVFAFQNSGVTQAVTGAMQNTQFTVVYLGSGANDQ